MKLYYLILSRFSSWTLDFDLKPVKNLSHSPYIGLTLCAKTSAKGTQWNHSKKIHNAKNFHNSIMFYPNILFSNNYVRANASAENPTQLN